MTSCFSAWTSRSLKDSEYSKSSPSGLARGECWCSTCRFSWLGHQSSLVLGRLSLGVGDEIAGLSLSLPWSDTWSHSCLACLALLFGVVEVVGLLGFQGTCWASGITVSPTAAHSGHRPQYATSASSISKPRSSAAVRHGADPTEQSTSTTRPHWRQIRWWWLSRTRDSNRAAEPAG